MYGLAIAFLFLVLMKNVNNSCISIGFYFLTFTAITFYQLLEFKSKANDAFCAMCNDGGLCKIFCESKIATRILSIIIASISSFSMMAFLYTTSDLFYLAIALDIVFFYYIYNGVSRKISEEFSVNAIGFFKEISTNFVNISFLLTLFVIVNLATADSTLELSPDLFNKVNAEINHGCRYFQHLVRTTYFFDLFIQSLMNIDGLGKYLFALIYVVSLSILPFFSITILFKFSYNKSEEIVEKLQ